MVVKDRSLRFLLDAAAAGLVLAGLRTRYVALLLVLAAFLDGAILAFHAVFRRALSWLTISNQAGEGAAVAGVALSLAAPYLLVIGAVSALILYLHGRWAAAWLRPKRVAAAAALVWLAVFLGLNLDHKPLVRLATFESADGIAHCYGFLITWLAECYYIDSSDVSAAAIERLDEPANRLLAVRDPIQLGSKIAVIQVESLDDALMDFRIGGKEVVSHLNGWKQEADYLRIQAPKRNGSCDSDFTLLFGGWPSLQAVPYRILGFPFERSIVAGLNGRGIHTSFFHGVSGNFFERRSAFSEMGFRTIKFREELLEEYKVPDAEWTLPDGLVFEAATQARQSQDAFFELIITGTSHAPFGFSLADHPKPFFPDSHASSEQYFDAMHYVDASLAGYVEALPDQTVVLIYGDHWSGIANSGLGYRSQMVDEFGLVPALLFRLAGGKPQTLLDLPESVTHSGQLRLVDLARWFRRSLELDPDGPGADVGRLAQPRRAAPAPTAPRL